MESSTAVPCEQLALKSVTVTNSDVFSCRKKPHDCGKQSDPFTHQNDLHLQANVIGYSVETKRERETLVAWPYAFVKVHRGTLGW